MPLVEFSYNNNFQTSIGMAPYEALYGKKCRSPICWDDVGERKLLGLNLVQVTTKKIRLIQERLRTAQIEKLCRQQEARIGISSVFFLKVSLMKMK